MDDLKKSALDREKLLDALQFAKDNGLEEIEVDGVKMKVPLVQSNEPHSDIKMIETPYDNMSDDEVLFWATDYFDDLQAEKEARKKILEEDSDVKNG